ncbi:MAG: FecR domain-containing protein [Deltaproteobacteria bacterium]|nr:FecR domain-containing protein [Deltaproteobacteria bacterium]
MSEHERDDAPPPALRAMIDEVRASGPELDWDRLEARLFDGDGSVRERSGLVRREQLAANESAPRRHGFAAVAAGLALAAAFAAAVLSPTRAVDQSKPAQVAVVRAPLLGEGGQPVAVGQRIVAPAGMWLRAADRVAVRLEPGTVATVVDVGERVHLALERGAVAADVVPVAGGEPFAVDVAGKRVAVHGTRLRVALVGGSVEVAVSEGSAVVGAPRGAGRTEGVLVGAGAVGRFEPSAAASAANIAPDAKLAHDLVDGSLASLTSKAAPATTVAIESTTATVAAAAPGPVAVAPIAKHAPAAPTVTTPEPPPAPEPPKVLAGLTAEQMSEPLSKLGPALQVCARKGGAGVVYVIEQNLTIKIHPSGKAELVGSDPGLDTPDRPCWSGVVAGVAFPVAEGPTTVTHRVVVGK